ncbi:conserved hypothetical protein [Ricinus communis]|uniref:Uncharacterized protein n=1 Tax=Ricinus communis TaxID=3988 RepID=B9SAD5_RICCO|nr:conserved hypothetical protein [Ricinus communis]
MEFLGWQFGKYTITNFEKTCSLFCYCWQASKGSGQVGGGTPEGLQLKTLTRGLTRMKPGIMFHYNVLFRVIEAYQLGEVFEGNDEVINDGKEIVVAKLTRLIHKELPSLMSFCPGGYHLVFPCLETLTVEGCTQITTRFTVASNCSVHAKNEKPQIVEEDVASGSATVQTAASPIIANEGINWNRCEQHDALPPYMDHEDNGKAVQASSSSCTRPTSTIKSRNLVTKKKKKKVKEGEVNGEQLEKQDHDSHFQGMGCCLNRDGCYCYTVLQLLPPSSLPATCNDFLTKLKLFVGIM